MQTHNMTVNEPKSIWHVWKIAEGYRQSRHLSESDSYKPGQHSTADCSLSLRAAKPPAALVVLWKDMKEADLNKKSSQ